MCSLVSDIDLDSDYDSSDSDEELKTDASATTEDVQVARVLNSLYDQHSLEQDLLSHQHQDTDPSIPITAGEKYWEMVRTLYQCKLGTSWCNLVHLGTSWYYLDLFGSIWIYLVLFKYVYNAVICSEHKRALARSCEHIESQHITPIKYHKQNTTINPHIPSHNIS